MPLNNCSLAFFTSRGKRINTVVANIDNSPFMKVRVERGEVEVDTVFLRLSYNKENLIMQGATLVNS
jgi:hypothetical protein